VGGIELTGQFGNLGFKFFTILEVML